VSGFIRGGRELIEGGVTEETCDVCIVGSGAGGAVTAARLAEAGLDVVVLEAGGHYTKRDFELQEASAYPKLYQDGGARATSDLAISILQGRSVGGSTTVNWTTCFRTPERVLENWRRRHGVELDAAALAPHFEAVEERLNISTWDASLANANNRKLLDGAEALGWEASPLRRNVRGCANSGYCSFGCPVDGKQAMHVTYLPDAVRLGARVYADVRADRIEVKRGRVTAVHASVLDRATRRPAGPTLTVRPKVCALAGGALNSPALLLRSKLDHNKRVGRRTFLHPVVAVIGVFDDPVSGFYGAPQSVGSHQFIDRGEERVGFFMEAAPVHPMLTAASLPLFGDGLQSMMRQLDRLGVLLGLSVDGLIEGDEGGTVSLRRDGRLRVDYPIRPELAESFRASHEALARIQLAAGAREVLTGHKDPLRIRNERDLSLLDTVEYGAHRHAIFTAHQMGGCAMGADPKTSVVGLDHRHRGVDNLFVVDGSVLPTALGVNPSETIYGLAHRAATFVGEAV